MAMAMAGLIVVIHALGDYERLVSIYQPLVRAMVAASVLALLVAWWRPTPWLLALLLVSTLGAVWWVAVDRWLRLDDPDEALPG